jgi:hypothetical protein
MSKTEKSTIAVKGTPVTVIARYRDAERTDYIIQNWLRNRNTIEFLGIGRV